MTYKQFHGVDPDKYFTGEFWVPGELRALGQPINIGYEPLDPRSKKIGSRYVHDFVDKKHIYLFGRNGKGRVKVYRTWPANMVVMGYFLGLEYLDLDGVKRTIKGSRSAYLCKFKRQLAVVHKKTGVQLHLFGGKLTVTDWIRG